MTDRYTIENNTCTVFFEKAGELTKKRADLILNLPCVTECDSVDVFVGVLVTDIKMDAFWYCKNLTSIDIQGTITNISDWAFNSCCKLKNVSLPDSITKIGDNAFENCTALSHIVLPRKLHEIGSWAFANCPNITNVNLPKELENIGSWAFSDCTGLTSVNIPEDVSLFDCSAFSGCTNLTYVTVDENHPDLRSVDGNLYSKDATELIMYAKGKREASFLVPDGVSHIGRLAFHNCIFLEKITLGDYATEIDLSAFMGCDNLTSILVKDGNCSFKSVNGNLYTKDGSALVLKAPGKDKKLKKQRKP